MIVDLYGYQVSWNVMIGCGVVAIVLLIVLWKLDVVRFPLLNEMNDEK